MTPFEFAMLTLMLLFCATNIKPIDRNTPFWGSVVFTLAFTAALTAILAIQGV